MPPDGSNCHQPHATPASSSTSHPGSSIWHPTHVVAQLCSLALLSVPQESSCRAHPCCQLRGFAWPCTPTVCSARSCPGCSHKGQVQACERLRHKEKRGAFVRGKTTEDVGKLDKVCIGGKELKMVTVSRCLGSMIECDGNTDLDVDTRLAVARSTFNQLCPLWKSTTLSTRV